MNILESISRSTSFVPEDATLDDIALILAESSVGIVGITSGGMPVGTLSDRDLVSRAAALGRDLSKLRAKDLIDRQPVTIEWQSDDSDLMDAFILMCRSKAKHAVVMRSGIPFGVVSFSALTRHILVD
ncbi:MAG: CBS domain-containing protein [Fimbriimonas sp.]|nr:CBS domain-containing protein [Fimbriimonas sp.]